MHNKRTSDAKSKLVNLSSDFGLNQTADNISNSMIMQEERSQYAAVGSTESKLDTFRNIQRIVTSPKYAGGSKHKLHAKITRYGHNLKQQFNDFAFKQRKESVNSLSTYLTAQAKNKTRNDSERIEAARSRKKELLKEAAIAAAAPRKIDTRGMNRREKIEAGMRSGQILLQSQQLR